MLVFAASGVLALSAVVQAPPRAVRADLTTCALTGEYVLSAAVAVTGEAQFSGRMTFTPPASCAADAAGTVALELSILAAGGGDPIPFAGSLTYAVDAAGGLTIGSGLIRGRVGGVAETGVANDAVFAGDPVPGAATIRLAGTAVRVDLAGVAGPAGPQGVPGPPGPAGPNVLAAGSAGAPALSFTTSGSTGLFSSAANTLDIATAGADRLQIGPAGDVNVLGGKLSLKDGGSIVLSNGSCGAPAVSFAASPATGFFYGTGNAKNEIFFCSNGTHQFAVAEVGKGVVVPAGGGYLFNPTTDFSSTYDAGLWRVAPGVIGQHRFGNPQTFQVYNTRTDAANYEAGVAGWTGNSYRVGTTQAGTGVARDLVFLAGGTDRWKIPPSGHLAAVTDDAVDVGAPGARPRNVLLSGQVRLGAAPATSLPGAIFFSGVGFAALGKPDNGTVVYCSDCTLASPCAAGGTGALAKRLGGVWVCN
jgi:hypothetical protein